MSYQVIARKWRPQTFEEVTGQEAITRTLRNAIEHERLHHAYLFSGARGVGKTTTARLLAKALNCHKTSKPNPRPCSPNDPDPCVSCIEIAEGRSMDVLEIDAASNTGVDNIREVIINNLGIAPARDRYKVFIIDEVHMLSASSFNALLKSVEEPPPRVVFIMATTELHKVPDTILSRCQEFEFRTIATAKIFERLKLIAEAEGINISDDALREIARAGEGSMRDAQSAFDQVISFSGETIDIKDVTTALGIASSEMLSQTINAIATKNAREALAVVDELNHRGQDLRNFCRHLLSHFRDLLVVKIAAGGSEEGLLDSAVFSPEELTQQAQNFTESDLIRFFNSLSETESELKNASQPRYALEVGIIKLIEMRRLASLEKILERLANLEGAFSNGNASIPSPAKSESSGSGSSSSFAEPNKEKKTLITDFPLDEVPFPVSSAETSPVVAPPEAPFSVPEAIFDKPVEAVAFSPATNGDFSVKSVVETPKSEIPQFSTENFLDSISIKLPPITSEDLEHIEDNWLDNAFEERLRREGDELNIITNASSLVQNIASTNGSASKVESQTSNGSTGFATVRAQAKPSFLPPVFETETSTEMPVLPENPTKADLWHYAENHPKVKLAMRIFRAKIMSVTPKEE